MNIIAVRVHEFTHGRPPFTGGDNLPERQLGSGQARVIN